MYCVVAEGVLRGGDYKVLSLESVVEDNYGCGKELWKSLSVNTGNCTN